MLQRLKIFGGILIIIIIIFILFFPEGKSVSNSSSDGKVHLNYWYVTGTKEEIPYHATEFNKIQDSIFVEITPIPWNEHEKKILTSILSGNPPDVIGLVTPIPKWASRMALTPIDQFIYKDNFDTSLFFSSLWKEMKWQNKTYGLPIYSNSYAFFYNKKLFKEVGLDPNKPPNTWDEVIQYSKLLSKKNKKGNIIQMGFIPHYGNLQTSILIAFELGAKFLSDDGKKISLTNPEMVKALQWEVDFYNDYSYRQASTFAAGFGYGNQHGFISEKVAMMVLDNTFPEQIKIYNPNLDYGVAMIPTFGNSQTASSSGSWWLAIPRGAKNANAAWEFLKFATNTSTQLNEALKMNVNLFPSNKKAANDSTFLAKDKSLKIFVKQMDYAFSPSIVPLVHDIFWREFLNAREKALNKIQSPFESLEEAENIIQKRLDEAIEYDEYVRAKVKNNNL